MQDAGFQFAFDAIRVKFKPSAKDMQKAEECGTDLAQALQKRRRKEEKQSVSQPKTGMSPSRFFLVEDPCLTSFSVLPVLARWVWLKG